MKEHVWSQILSGGLIVVSLSLLAGCQSVPESQAVVEPAQTEVSQTVNMSAGPASEVQTPVNVDPADRKFFNPGYGVNRAEYETSEALTNVDPADRKFFNPGYLAYAPRNDLTVYHQSEWGRTRKTDLSIEEKALAVYHQSEWSRTPKNGSSVEETPLAIYHQSEWDRTPNTGLSIEVIRKIDPADRKFFIPGYGVYAGAEE